MQSSATCTTGVDLRTACDDPTGEILAEFYPNERDFVHAVHFVEKRCLTRLNVNAPLAHTGHSTVYRAYSQLYRRYVAIKILHKNAIPQFVADKFLPRELEVTALAHHPHLCTCLEIYEANETKLIIISEFYSGGTLLRLVLKNDGISESNAARMFRQLIEALNYLHSHDVVHRDVKLENILLDEKCDIKLADFGFSRFIKRAERSTSFCGSRPYCAPNIIRKNPYNAFASDWYAVGITLYTMLTGVYPEDQVNTETHEFIALKFPKACPSLQAQRLIESLVCEDESRRAGYEECMNSEWLRMHTNGKWIMADPYFIYEVFTSVN